MRREGERERGGEGVKGEGGEGVGNFLIQLSLYLDSNSWVRGEGG
jgi:hypothetical protein